MGSNPVGVAIRANVAQILGKAIKWNHIASFGCLVAAVFFALHKWA